MADPEERPRFEILEHTADIGLGARGKTLEELFENAAAGMVEILGVAAGHGSQHVDFVVEADDRAALLVRFLDELIYLVDARGARIGGITTRFESPTRSERIPRGNARPVGRESDPAAARFYLPS